MTKPSRNDPCPCGSGKKSKKCCLGKTPEPQAQAAGPSSEERELRAELLAYCTSMRFDKDIVNAKTAFFPENYPVDDPNLELPQGFLDWYLFSYVLPEWDKTPLEMFHEMRGYGLNDKKRALLDEWTRSRFGIYRVSKSNTPNAFIFINVFSDDEVLVDGTSLDSLPDDVLVITRLLPIENFFILEGQATLLPEEYLDDLAGILRDYGSRHGELCSTGNETADLISRRGDLVNRALMTMRESLEM